MADATLQIVTNQIHMLIDRGNYIASRAEALYREGEWHDAAHRAITFYNQGKITEDELLTSLIALRKRFVSEEAL